jgi:crotonobetaine/carnitine-CoA ligase
VDAVPARPRSLAALVRDAAQAWPERIGMVFDEGPTSLTFTDLDVRSDVICRALSDIGVRPGERVAVMLRNRPEFPLTWFGLAKLGAAMVPMNVYYKANDAAYILSHSQATAVVTQEEFLPLLRQVIDSLDGPRPRIVCVDDVDDLEVVLLDSRPGAHPLPPVDIARCFPETTVNIQYTSGTTGAPKGCVLSQFYWTRLARTVATTPPGLSETDVLLTAQPFYYMDPQWNTCVALHTGARLVVLDRFHPSTFWDRVREHGVTFFYCLGMMPAAMLRMPESPADRDHEVRFISCSAIPKNLHATLEDRWGAPWFEAFGMTETGSGTRLLPAHHDENVGLGCIGLPNADREARVLDPDGRPVPRGTQGELVFRGPGMMDAYFADPDATSAAFRDGWFHTGDIVYQDPSGLIYYIGRTKDSIRRSGENIAASEVEQVLMEHPAVAAAACIPVPDDLRGEEVKAYLVLANGTEPGSVDPADLHSWCSERLAYFKVPRFWTFVPDFPRTPSVRVAKSELIVGVSDLRSGAYDADAKAWN